MMKVKVFTCDTDELEDRITEWLSSNDVDIKHVVTSSSSSQMGIREQYVIIFYKEKKII